jgi:hypothetical protein
MTGFGRSVARPTHHIMRREKNSANDPLTECARPDIITFLLTEGLTMPDLPLEPLKNIYGEPQFANVKGDGGANGVGVYGNTVNAAGVWGHSASGIGTYGASDTNNGVMGRSDGAQASGVYGQNDSTGFGAAGRSAGGVGVLGDSSHSNGVYGHSGSATASGVYGQNDSTGFGVAGRSPGGIGVLGDGGKLAGKFVGDVEVSGNISLTGANSDITLTGGDCAEDFDSLEAAAIGPGAVLVIGADDGLELSRGPYDKRVAGVVSGAGAYKPGLVLDRQAVREGRVPVALIGKVFCKVDAQYSSVEVGDLLTTSPTCGHAMKATDPARAFGAVIGKALRPLASGQGLIPILVALQ